MTLSYKVFRYFSKVNYIPFVNRVVSVSYNRIKDEAYWRDTKYQDGMSASLYVFGLCILRFNVKSRISDVYLAREHKTVHDCLDEMISQGLIPPVDTQSNVLECGCNCGVFLQSLHNRFGCAVCGIDISERAISVAENELFADKDKSLFISHDVLDTSFFEQFEDRHFSHTFVMSHLVHLETGPTKRRYIEQLKRISNVIIAFERIPTREDTGNNSGRYIEDLSSEYGFICHKTISKPGRDGKKLVGFFYWSPP